MTAKHAAVLFDVLLLGLIGYVAPRCDIVVTVSLSIAALLSILWQVILFQSLPGGSRSVSVQWRLRPPHYVQAALQLLLYGYWSLYWDEVARYTPLIIAQMLLAYHFEMVLSWRRPGDVWHLGVGPLPIILSTNLFLWFNEEYFYLQILLIAGIYLGKEFLTTVRDGRRRHIFNPSGLALSITSVVLLMSGDPEIHKGTDLIASFGLPPNFYEVVFLLGLVVQVLFGTTLVTFGAGVALYLLWATSEAVFGALTAPGPFDPSVFLGLTFLVTDPSTSPRTRTGRFLFGFTYGAGVFFMRLLLLYNQEPSSYDKILMVPIVNLMVKPFDTLGQRVERFVGEESVIARVFGRPILWLGFYVVFFVFISPSLKSPRIFDKMLLPPVGSVTSDLGKSLASRLFCRELFPDAYRPFGFRGEIAHYTEITSMYEQGPIVWFARQGRPIPQFDFMSPVNSGSDPSPPVGPRDPGVPNRFIAWWRA